MWQTLTYLLIQDRMKNDQTYFAKVCRQTLFKIVVFNADKEEIHFRMFTAVRIHKAVDVLILSTKY